MTAPTSSNLPPVPQAKAPAQVAGVASRGATQAGDGRERIRELELTQARLRNQLELLATHDDLTGLLNRTAFLLKLSDWIDNRRHKAIALFVSDLNRFRQINDALGHAVGDTLLKIVANRIVRLPDGPLLAGRIDGDAFALALGFDDWPDQDIPGSLQIEVEQVAQKLLDAIGEKTRVHSRTLRIGARIGVALYPQDCPDADTLMQRAEQATNDARARGPECVLIYDPRRGDSAARRLETEFNLREALNHGSLACVYQPKIELTSGIPVGVEALVRWNLPDGRVLLPPRFIPLAEQTGLVKPIGLWVLNQALRQATELSARRGPIDLCINVSPLQLRDYEFHRDVRAALLEHNFPAERLTLELTETSLIEDMREASDILGDFAALGVKIAIDDFGTGYAGLSYLKNLPISEIKIDRSFIKGCAIDAFDAAIVNGLVEIAHNIGLRIVAEGVERADQLSFLSQVKCDLVQGFFVGRPMPLAELMNLESLWRTRSPVIAA